jgi:short subunit dehydrogenase-like uncharacterized protein
MLNKVDLIVWGATGFTGRLVVEYLLRQYGAQPDSFKWAIAARNSLKLEKLREELEREFPDANSLPCLIADAHDQNSLVAMVEQTRVVISTVGPYWTNGSTLIKACLERNTHYVDLTGETPWIREMIDAHHEMANEQKLRIVNCCGYDSIPSDLGVLVLQNHVFAKHSVYLKDIQLYVGPTKGGISGGTISSMMGIMAHATNPKVRRVLGNPYALNPKDKVKGPDGSDQMGLKWEPKQGVWTAPFVMASINSRVVRRSHALSGYPYGTDFKYQECTAFPKGLKGWTMAAGLTAGLAGFISVSAFSPTRWFLQRAFLPDPGEGPSKSLQEKGYFRIVLRGQTQDGEVWSGFVSGDRDPGYGQTAIMLSEAALSIVLNEDILPQVFGIVTPATSLGMPLVERLRESGMTFLAVQGKCGFSLPS